MLLPLVILGALAGGALFAATRPQAPKGVDLFPSLPPLPRLPDLPNALEAQPEEAARPPLQQQQEQAPIQSRPSATKTRRFLNPLADGPFRVTSPYGPRRHPVTGEEGSMHSGLDLGAPSGTPVYSADGGRVTKVWIEDPIVGNGIKIWHPDGMSTAYMHLARAPRAVVGQVVAKGQQIGEVGATGRATGPHLHFMVYLASGATVDPRPWTDPSPWTPGRDTSRAMV